MTAQASARTVPTRVPCPHCAYHAPNAGSLPMHLAAKHPEVSTGGMSEPFCEAISISTGSRCQQPERWLEQMRTSPNGTVLLEERRVCQQHGRMLERQGWTFVRELHPVPGFERQVPA